jgi:hypothetical protein
MIEYRGYLIFGTATKTDPSSPDWRAVGIAYRKTSEGLIVQIERTGGPMFTTKGAAEQEGLALSREWVDEQLRSNQVQEESRSNLLH